MADDTGDPLKAAGTAAANASQVTASPVLTRDGRLSPRDRDTAEALARLDPHLSGLFTVGHELLQDLSNPGVCFFVAHAGRELANGLERIHFSAKPSPPKLRQTYLDFSDLLYGRTTCAYGRWSRSSPRPAARAPTTSLALRASS